MIDGLINIVVLLVILVTLVVIHELGHFVVARRAGVRVHEFGVGFPPRARILFRGRDTLYTLNWLPIGGFVRLEGEEGESEDPRAFVNQRLRTRLVILLAGVVMNFLLAWLIFSLIAGLADPISNIRVATVQPGSPAQLAGLKGGAEIGTDADGKPIIDDSGDLIIAIDGQRFPVFDRIDAADAPIAYLRDHAGKTVTLTIRSTDGTVHDVVATLRVRDPNAERGAALIAQLRAKGVLSRVAGQFGLGGATERIGALGIGYTKLQREDLQRGPFEAISMGLARTFDASTLILRGIGELVTNLSNPQVSGPVGIVSAVGVVRTELPPVFLLWLIGLLSANLAVVNALPFPPMDGGRIAVSLVQRLSGNRISPTLERSVYLAGFVALMALLAWITMFDLQRLGGT